MTAHIRPTSRNLSLAIAWLAFAILPLPSLASSQPESKILDQVDYQQRIGNPLPGELKFRNAKGEMVSVASLSDDKPLILALAWYNCPQLCPMLLDRIANTTEALPFDSDEYRVAIVSIAPDEGPEDARRIHAELRNRHGDATQHWQLLTGKKPAIDALADAAGFHYAYDAESGDYAHPAGVVISAPGGQITHYLLGMRPEAPDLRLALVEAGQGELGSPLQKILVRCYRFNPQTGQYTFAIMNVMRAAGIGSALTLAGAILWMRRREHS